jgi:hypothetical protein
MQTHAANKGTQCKLEQEPWRIIQISRDMNWLRKRACRDYSALALDWLNPVVRCGHDACLRWQPDMWDGGQPQSTRGPFAACFTLRLTGVCSADFPARAAICNVLLVEQLSWAQDARSTLGYLNNGRSKREPQASSLFELIYIQTSRTRSQPPLQSVSSGELCSADFICKYQGTDCQC